jgi:DNA repair exonuclease SbcCD ATPase subunit
LCGKDLQDVPEVVAKNAAIKGAAELKDAEAALLSEAQKLEQAEYDRLRKLQDAHQAFITKHGRYWKLTPNGAEWLGEVPKPIVTMNVDVSAERRKLVKIQEVETRLRQARESLNRLEYVTVPDTVEAESVVRDYEQVTALIALQRQAVDSLRIQVEGLKAEELAYGYALQNYKAQKANLEQQIAGLEDTIRQADFHNELIRKLRASRQSIASQLWNNVLAVVSLTFSQIRGTQSHVERRDSEFIVNGEPVGDLSGSTIDMLGLAIRLSLSRVFLPNLPFIFMDEVFAGCDEQRELAGLGALASCGIGQVLLVTHSDLGDALAANLIEL